MALIRTIKNSFKDLIPPQNKSYGKLKINISFWPKEKIIKKQKILFFERNLLADELSGKEPIEQIIFLKGKKEKITFFQLRDLLSDLGFNLDVRFSGKRLANFSGVMNFGGFVLPGWQIFAEVVTFFFPFLEKLIFFKISPGKKRLHIRVYGDEKHYWLITAHVDINWLEWSKPRLVFKGHFRFGQGDYSKGTSLMYQLLSNFLLKMEKNEIWQRKDIEEILRK